MIRAIVTMPPYAPFFEEVIAHPMVAGVRLNTAMTVKDSLSELLEAWKKRAGGKTIWIDLKTRQLRTTGYWVPPFTEIQITHPIEVNTPVEAIFGDGSHSATVVAVEGNRLFMLEGPRRVVGPGESLNIIDSSLKVKGFLTELDKGYLEAALEMGLRHFMVSFVEIPEDLDTLRKYSDSLELVAKIESQKGILFAKNQWEGKGRLMAARGDLYVEIPRPHQLIEVLEDIIRKDPDAIAASRIFPSLTQSLEPSAGDIMDVDNLLKMGYKTLMLGDDICLRRDSVISALNLLAALARPYEKDDPK